MIFLIFSPLYKGRRPVTDRAFFFRKMFPGIIFPFFRKLKEKEDEKIEEYRLNLDPAAAEFYHVIAEKVGKTPERVMEDLLFRFAGDISLSALGKK